MEEHIQEALPQQEYEQEVAQESIIDQLYQKVIDDKKKYMMKPNGRIPYVVVPFYDAYGKYNTEGFGIGRLNDVLVLVLLLCIGYYVMKHFVNK